ncbi:hypothetical protein NP233_g1346 [Leucocoprinus birnbaumii]|uniref:Uncharacterized protein n=1 Tax=Leucocoprinus birnbaumii TaxID=56174 RepID=A0AAD5W161_9AGAR|nr:hypothetical protein NP233_g1346 [Leucocoprinus birnbaumii]
MFKERDVKLCRVFHSGQQPAPFEEKNPSQNLLDLTKQKDEKVSLKAILTVHFQCFNTVDTNLDICVFAAQQESTDSTTASSQKSTTQPPQTTGKTTLGSAPSENLTPRSNSPLPSGRNTPNYEKGGDGVNAHCSARGRNLKNMSLQAVWSVVYEAVQP